MTKLLEQAIAAVRKLPPEAQDNVAKAMLSLVGDDEIYELSPEECAAIHESKAAAARGEFASDEQVRTVWAKYGL